MKKSIFIILFYIFLLVSCNSKILNKEKKLKVVTTIFPIYDFTKNIIGDNDIDLQMIVKPGTEIHSFNATPSDIIDIQNCDVFIYIGGESEIFADKVINSIYTNNKKIVKLLDYVVALDEEIIEGMENTDDDDHTEHIYDEHIYTSPKNAILIVDAIAKTMQEVDIKNADTYKANAKKYNEQIEILDNKIRKIIDSSKRKIIVFGDRFPFRYLVNEYNLEYRAPFTGCSSQVDVSPKTISYLIKYINDNNIPYLFTIELSNEKIVNTLVEQTGAKKLKLHSAQNISREEFNSGIGYLDIINDNIKSLEIGLN